MKVLLTGATGFVGSYVLRKLLAQSGVEVAVLLRPSSDLWRTADIVEQARQFRVNFSDPSEIGQVFADFRPDTVVHLAWAGVLGKDRNDPLQVANLTTAMDLLKLSAEYGVKHWIGLGSQAEYGPCAKRIDETTPTRPTTLYGAVKLATCTVAGELCRAHGIRFAWLRLFSSYGPKDNQDWMIPYLINQFLQKRRPSVTKGEQLWDYIFIDDAAEAITRIALAPQATGIFNLGSGNAPLLRDVITEIRDMIDPSQGIGFGETPYRPDQVMHLEANIDRLASTVGWHPATSIHDGLLQTTSWYIKNAKPQ
jgi:UDP-glucose 4-epimerase